MQFSFFVACVSKIDLTICVRSLLSIVIDSNLCNYFEPRFLRPVDFLDVLEGNDATKHSNFDAIETELLDAVKSFYKALTTGDQDAIGTIFSESTSKEVSEVRGFRNE